MKRIFSVLCLCLLTLALLLTATACGETPDPDPKPTPTPTPESNVISEGQSDYVFIYPDGDDDTKAIAQKLAAEMQNEIRIRFSVKSDAASTTDHEIVVGLCNRPTVTEKYTLATDTKDFCWSIVSDGVRLGLYANSELGYSKIVADLLKLMSDEQTLTVSADLALDGKYLYTTYIKSVMSAMNKKLQADEAEKSELVPALETKLAAFENKDFLDWNATKVPTATTDLTEAAQKAGYSTDVKLNEQHPRILFTSDDLEDIRLALYTDEDEMQTLQTAVSSALLHMGTLSECKGKSTDGTITNYNESVLKDIQALAFYYQLTEIDYYGYAAILAMKNNLKSFVMCKVASDQCRYFGYTMYTAACVYDWCYDLLNETDKFQLRLGVEYKCCQGTSTGQYTDTATGKTATAGGGAKMEVGFPPSLQNALSGHGAEAQVLRDYLAAAIAFYDEVPSWWQYIGGRFYKEFVTVRNEVYKSDCMVEGVGNYGPYRFGFDCYSAWIAESATGENPYIDQMQNIGYTLLASICKDQGLKSIEEAMLLGQDDTIWRYVRSDIISDVYMLAYLYDDATLRANAEYFARYNGSYGRVSVAERCITLGTLPKSASDRKAGLKAIVYSAGFNQEILARNNTRTDTAVVVMLSGAQKFAGGHTHFDSGDFQIYYKGFLSVQDGLYDVYGSTHHYYYHQASISKNAMLVYNAANKNLDSGYYCGGQKLSNNSYQAGTAWINSDTDWKGRVTGVKYGYYDEKGEQGKYAFISNDLTTAYHANTVNYISRSTLVTFPENADVPMVMFVYDNIDAKDAFPTTFLLQCAEEPVVNESEMTVTVDNGKGKLIAKNLFGASEITTYGGFEKDSSTGQYKTRFYVPYANKVLNSTSNQGSTYVQTNLKSCWGHADFNATGKTNSDYVTALYVTDSTNKKEYTVTGITADGYTGGTAFGQVALFSTSKDFATEGTTFTVNGSGTLDYYIGGVAAGTWNVTVGGTSVGSFTVAESEHLLNFSAPAGEVVFTMAK